jgi:hypothetical protein
MASNAAPEFPIRLKAFAGVYACLSLFLIFFIPRYIPGKFVASDSYTFGYNNRIGFLLFVLFAAIGSTWWRRFSMPAMPVEASPFVRRRTVWMCMAISFGMCLFMYFCTARLGHFGESSYLINRIELTSRGLRPYRDFEYAYGISFLFLPVAISRVFHLSIPNSYYMFWMLN